MSGAPRPLARGFTLRELAQRWRVGRDKVRAWVMAGRLAAINVGADRGRPRFVVPPEAVLDFEQGRSAAAPPKPPRRRKRINVIDFYP
jgi:hypothetical protein